VDEQELVKAMPAIIIDNAISFSEFIGLRTSYGGSVFVKRKARRIYAIRTRLFLTRKILHCNDNCAIEVDKSDREACKCYIGLVRLYRDSNRGAWKASS
jgi:hypothetical protein